MLEQNMITVGDIKEFIKNMSSDSKIKIDNGGTFVNISKIRCINNDLVTIIPIETDVDKSTRVGELKGLTETFLASLLHNAQHETESNEKLINTAEQLAKDFMNHKFDTDV